jgi:hypothetical protein
MAARSWAAFAPLSPLTSSSAMTGASTIARSDPNRLSNCRPSSTALVPLKPTRTRMATSSASVRACAPRDKSRSRGRSSCGHETIPFDLVFVAAIRLVPFRVSPRPVRRTQS